MQYGRVLAVAAVAAAFGCTDGTTPSTPNTPEPDKPALSVAGAGFTTTNTEAVADGGDGTGHCKNGNEAINCNIYDGKDFVWLNGGPGTAALGAGTYVFAVLEPGGQGGNNNPNDGTPKNLSDLSPTTLTPGGDDWHNRVFTIDADGNITYDGTHDFNHNKIRLMPYDDTPNPGGVYIMAICSLDGRDESAANEPGVNPALCKYDAFKVLAGDEEVVTPGAALTADKTADGSADRTFAWAITKAVNKTVVKQVGGSATFTYTVTAAHTVGTLGNVKVTGIITVTNPNSDAVAIDGISDQLSNGTVCAVTNGGSQTLAAGDTEFDYSCDLSAVAQGLDNSGEVTWSEQLLENGDLLAAGSTSFGAEDIQFTETAVDNCVNVTDKFNGGTADQLGLVCAGDAPAASNLNGSSLANFSEAYTLLNPARTFTFKYNRSVMVPAYDCITRNNEAKFITTGSGAYGTASASVQVCGPARTGGLTIGFWQNRNGQAIITSGGVVGTVCKSGAWLRGYAPFQDLSATATCAQVATYVTNIIKAASSAGTSMNPMLKAQMLATALDVYFSNPVLGGNQINAPAPIGGVSIDLTIPQNVTGAFGGASSLTVLQLLAYAASQSNSGGSAWYGQVKTTQELAKNTFDNINNERAFGA